MVEKIPSWIEKLLLPKLSEITGEIKAINARIDSLEKRVNSLEKTFDERFASLRNEMLTRFEAVDKKIESLRNEMNSLRNEMLARFEIVNNKFDSLEKTIPMIEKLKELEIRIARLEKEKQV